MSRLRASTSSRPEPADDSLLAVRGVSHSYSSMPGEVLSGVSLEAGRGSFTSVIGPSGCGKSTLLRLLSGIGTPDAGTLSIFGRTPHEAAADKRIGLVPQAPALLPWLTVRGNVELPARVNRAAERRRRQAAGPVGKGSTGGEARRRVADEHLDAVGLLHVADRYPAQLSGGMQQRVAIARALAVGPDVLLMDEPFSAVDELTREALRGELLAVWERARTTVVFVTHSIREAVVLSDTVVVMSGRPGRVHDVVQVDLPRPRPAAPTPGHALHAVEARLHESLTGAWRSA